MNAAGEKLWDRAYGGLGYDTPIFAKETEDGGFVVIGDTYSVGIAGNKGVEGTGIWTLKLDSRGFKEAEFIFPGHAYNLFVGDTGVSIYALAENSLSMSELNLNILRRVGVSVRSLDARPYNVDVSTNLLDWTSLVIGFSGDLSLKETIAPNNRFFRVVQP